MCFYFGTVQNFSANDSDARSNNKKKETSTPLTLNSRRLANTAIAQVMLAKLSDPVAQWPTHRYSGVSAVGDVCSRLELVTDKQQTRE